MQATPEKLMFVQSIFPVIAVIIAVSVAGWVGTTWLRIKNGYPLESNWGKALHPQRDQETIERIELLSRKIRKCAG